jgi:peptidoglycan/xylan/chitin deacetylase (PgdA/CDA1 family)
MIHLTFDDGPDPVWTPAVLEALAAVQATATFFVLGERAAAWPAIVERVLGAGHAVEVHGHGHLRHSATPRECVEGDLDAALAVLAGLGVNPRFWRAPYGDVAPFTAEIAAERGLELVGWTADTNDWTGAPVEAMLAAVEPQLAPGAIVLAHDAIGPGAPRTTCEETVRLIRPLVAAARDRGLEPSLLAADHRAVVQDVAVRVNELQVRPAGDQGDPQPA